MRNHEETSINEPKIRYIKNKKDPTLGYSETSGVRIIEKDGLFLKI